MGLLMHPVQKVPYYRSLSAKYGFGLLLFGPSDIDWDEGVVSGLILRNGNWQRGVFSLPATVYNRCYPEPTTVIKRLMEELGADRVFNSVTLFDKWQVFEILKSSEVGDYLPRTHLFTAESLGTLLAEENSLILKPRKGQAGRGIYRVDQQSSDTITISSEMDVALPLPGVSAELLAVFTPPEQYIAQQYIESMLWEGKRFDIRLIVQKGAAGQWVNSASMSRVAEPLALITNLYERLVHPQGILSDVVHSADEELELMEYISVTTARLLDGQIGVLGELSVDFLIDEDGHPWIVEANGKPDKGILHELKDTQMLEKVYLNPLAYQRYILKGGLEYHAEE